VAAPHARISELLRAHRIQPSAQRVAVAAYVLAATEHPTAEEVHARVRARFPMISRATIYNTLRAFVDGGLLRELTLHEGRVVYDPNLRPHHHFIDERTGRIEDLPWEALEVKRVEALKGFDVRDYSVVIRGRRK
jgi:Fe2+ or Zn2+ uptake regulation protein